MTQFKSRAWRITVALAPVAAFALTLAANRRWM